MSAGFRGKIRACSSYMVLYSNTVYTFFYVALGKFLILFHLCFLFCEVRIVIIVYPS